jgi:hypothetical protein
MNNKYATAVMAEQQNNFTMTNYDCDRTLFSQHDNNCLQHHVYQERQAYIPVHNEVPTSSSLGYIDNRITANVSRLVKFDYACVGGRCEWRCSNFVV